MPRSAGRAGAAGGERAAALRALARREHAGAELKRKLESRGFDADAAAGAIEDLARRGLQSDARFAEMLVRSRVRQGFGPIRIHAELEAAGVRGREAEAAIAAAEVDWRAQVAVAWRRRFKAQPADAAEWQKQYRFLASHGFEAEQIYTVLKAHGE